MNVLELQITNLSFLYEYLDWICGKPPLQHSLCLLQF